MWEMYLVGSEMAFRRGGHLVFQMQLARAIDTVPLTRDYMLDWERRQSAAEGQAALDRLRAFPTDNGDGPALYLKPLMERERKPAIRTTAKAAATRKS